MRSSTRTLIRSAGLGAALAASAVAAGLALAAPPRLQTAIFAGGCFWTMEHRLEDVPGVVSAVSGYTGGRFAHPTYEDVNTEKTGHLEAVKVTFDPAKISYPQLLDRYWHMIDPTQPDGQACDRAPSYHSAIFAVTPDQRRAAETSKAALNAGRFRGGVLTEIRNAQPFWPAEAYHQGFARRNPAQYAAYDRGCRRGDQLRVVWGDR